MTAADMTGLSDATSGRDDQQFRMGLWFIRMRWVACGVLAVLVALSASILEYLAPQSALPLGLLVACLVATNVFYDLCLRRRWLWRGLTELQIAMDLLILTGILHYSGGIENPATLTYVFHVIISGILLARRQCYATVVVGSGLFATMAILEMGGVIEHYTLLVFPHPEEEHGLFHAATKPMHVATVVAFHVVVMALAAYFTTTIMARLRSEEIRAKAGRQRLQRVLHATGAGFAILDRRLRPVWMNEQIRQWVASADEVGRGDLRDFHEWTGGPAGPAGATLRDGKVRVLERKGTDASGNERIFQVTVAPLVDEAGEVYQVVELIQDITERKLMEAEMMHSAKMAALGLLAAGIAHEVGNPLASIVARLRLLEEDRDEASLGESLELLRSQTERIARIVRNISQVARPAKDEWARVQINEILQEMLKVLRFHKHARRSRIVSEFAADLPQTTGMRDQLVQVFLNLGLNALEAMPEGGTLTIRTCRRLEEIRIEFADTGPGIDSKVLSRIFDPFFSTKDTGLGLGLSVVHNIIDAHGGRIDVRADVGRGTVFAVALPVRMSSGPTGATAGA